MSLSFLDPDDADLALGETQGDEFRFDFTIPSQNQSLNTQDHHRARTFKGLNDVSDC